MNNVPEYSVSELSNALKRLVESGFSHIRLHGEISNYKKHSSGHHYFTLKDHESCIDAVCWRGTPIQLHSPIQDGISVVCTGRVTTYAGRSKYQIVVESMEMAGIGALLQQIEVLKKQLQTEGLFNEERKRPIPFLPKRIGIITSPTGAVIKDILHRIRDRFPIPITLWPAAVQGDDAVKNIVTALHEFSAMSHLDPLKPDVLIIARGGGSLEDMMAFNNEEVARAAAQCSIPLISAIGHETDWCILDHIADHRAPTPTAAAERAVPVKSDLIYHIQTLEHRLDQAWRRMSRQQSDYLLALSRSTVVALRIIEQANQKFDDRMDRVTHVGKQWIERLERNVENLGQRLIHPRAYIEQLGLRLIHLSQRLGSSVLHLQQPMFQKLESVDNKYSHAMERYMTKITHPFQALCPVLETLSYQNTLNRGFCLVFDKSQRRILQSCQQAENEKNIHIQFSDGACDALVSTKSAQKKKPERRPKPTHPTEQSTLFD